jgi:HEAT repeat protein
MAETARDMGAFVEELLLAGAFSECLPVVEELKAAAARKPPIAPDACRQAVESIGTSSSLSEAATTLNDQTDDEFGTFEKLVRAIGVSTVPALIATYIREDGGAGADRATTVLGRLGPTAIPTIAAALEDKPWFVQRELAKALGRIGTPAAVSPLQSLLRRSDVRVLQTAVISLSSIADPAAERALHTVLKASTGEARAAVIASLVNLKDPRVVPMLGRVLQDSHPFSDEHPLVIDTLNALAMMRDDRALAAIAALARKKKWTSWSKTTQLRQSCVQTLSRIGTPKAKQTIADLASSGDFFLKRLARKAVTS